MLNKLTYVLTYHEIFFFFAVLERWLNIYDCESERSFRLFNQSIIFDYTKCRERVDNVRGGGRIPDIR